MTMNTDTTANRAREIYAATLASLIADASAARIYMGNGNATRGQAALGNTRSGSARDALRREFSVYRVTRFNTGGMLSVDRAVNLGITDADELRSLFNVTAIRIVASRNPRTPGGRGFYLDASIREAN